MSEKDEPKIDSGHTSIRSHEVKAGAAEGHGTHTSIHGQHVKVQSTTVASSHKTIDEDPVREAQTKPDDPDKAAKDGQA